MLRRAGSLLDAAERLVGWLEDSAIMLLLVAMTAIVNLQIFARYVFSAPMIWPEEVTRLTLVWITFLGAAAMGRRAADIAVTTFVEMLPTAGQRLALLLRDAVLVVLFAFVAREGVRLAAAVEGMPLVATEWPTALLAWPVALGGALMALHPALRMVRQLAGSGRLASGGTTPGSAAP
jgi:TRAP-type transport system small permease protein